MSRRADVARHSANVQSRKIKMLLIHVFLDFTSISLWYWKIGTLRYVPYYSKAWLLSSFCQELPTLNWKSCVIQQKSIRQDPCGIALQFPNSLASWWNYSITHWGRNCAIRVCRMFEDISSHKSEILVPTNTTERSKGIFSDNHAKKLIDLFQDMIQGAPISKPAILKRLANEELDKTLFNDYTVTQIVSRLK